MNIKHRKNSIEEMTKPAAKLTLIKDSSDEAGELLRETQKEANEASAENQEMGFSTPNAHRTRVLSLRLLALTLVAIDPFIQFLVNRVVWPSLPSSLLWITAVAIALGLGFLAKGGAHASTFDPECYRRSGRICSMLAGLVGVVCAASLSLLLFSRVASPEAVPFLEPLVNTSLWLLAECTPIVAGLLAAAAQAFDYPTVEIRRAKHLQKKVRELEQFHSWLREKDPGFPPTNPPPAGSTQSPAPIEGSSPADDRGRKISLAVAGATLMLMTLGARTAGAQQARNAAQPATGTCVIVADQSTSVDPVARELVVNRFLDTLPTFLKSQDCRTLKVGGFFDAGAFTMLQQFPLPDSPAHADCANAPVNAPRLPKLILETRGFADHYRTEAEKQCLNDEAKKEQRDSDAEKTLRSEVRSVLLPADPAHGTCTAIAGLLASLVAQNTRTALFISDLAETCSRRLPHIPVIQGQRILFLLVPSRGPIADTGPEALERVARWQMAVPNMKVILPSELGPTMWSEFASTERDPKAATNPSVVTSSTTPQ